MTELNETHDPNRRSWVESANDPASEFPVQNLPFGVFRRDQEQLRCGVAIGNQILDLRAASAAGLALYFKFPFPEFNVFLNLIRLKDLPTFYFLKYSYVTFLFTTPFFACSLLTSFLYMFVYNSPRCKAKLHTLPPYPDVGDREELAAIGDDLHHVPGAPFPRRRDQRDGHGDAAIGGRRHPRHASLIHRRAGFGRKGAHALIDLDERAFRSREHDGERAPALVDRTRGSDPDLNRPERHGRLRQREG